MSRIYLGHRDGAIRYRKSLVQERHAPIIKSLRHEKRDYLLPRVLHAPGDFFTMFERQKGAKLERLAGDISRRAALYFASARISLLLVLLLV